MVRNLLQYGVNTKMSILQYSPTIVLIKILECFVEMLIPFKSVPMHCSWDEFKIVYRPISINISLGNIIHKNKIPVKRQVMDMHSTSYAFDRDL